MAVSKMPGLGGTRSGGLRNRQIKGFFEVQNLLILQNNLEVETNNTGGTFATTHTASLTTLDTITQTHIVHRLMVEIDVSTANDLATETSVRCQLNGVTKGATYTPNMVGASASYRTFAWSFSINPNQTNTITIQVDETGAANAASRNFKVTAQVIELL